MSAIFGIIDFKGHPLQEEWIISMQADLAHRGPDGQGLYREESVVLGHMLLQVTPESVYDKSPYEEDGFVITANARLDEREAILDRLGIVGEERDRITDPLLLLRSFRKYGKEFAKDIYGDFAFAIWDKENRELFCGRDQMGVKPFLYYNQGGLFIFSTEYKAIKGLPCVNASLDWLLLRNRTLDIRDKLPQTHFKNIFRLAPAHILSLNNSDVSLWSYWQPAYNRNKRFVDEQDSAKTLRITLERVIKDHTRTHYNIGIPLSGGLDSGTITAITSRVLKGNENKLYSVSSIHNPESSGNAIPDEKAYISDILGDNPDITPIYVNNAELSFIDGLKAEFETQYSPVNTFWYVDKALFEKLNQNSVRRVLSGLYGDMTASNSLIDPIPFLLLSGRFSSVNMLLTKLHTASRISFSKAMLKTILGEIIPVWLKNNIHVILNRKIRKGYDLSEVPLRLHNREAVSLQKKINRAYRISNLKARDFANNIWPSGVEMFDAEWDCLASRHKMEISYPLADRRIVELLLSIPVEHFLAGGLRRGLIRMAMEGILPDKVRLRNDKGWYSPGFPQILKNDFAEIARMAEIRSLNDFYEKVIDRQGLKIKIEKLALKNKNSRFATEDWILIRILLLDLFVKWSEMND